MCDAFDVTPRTLRFYEAKELLFPIRHGTQRLFTRRDRARLKLILRGKRFGFSLEDIRQFLDMYDRDGIERGADCCAAYDLAMDRLAQMEAQRAELDVAIAELKVEIAEDAAVVAGHDSHAACAAPTDERLTRRTDPMTYAAPVKDMQFLLHDVLKVIETGHSGLWRSGRAVSPPRCWKRRASWPRTCWRR